ncbi:MAG: PorP/SprF family type IX secretion system membrane protein [Bacteroidetes bacterium]|nr:PorP/SprF family type IX secretion system membrane protein [Bacteroidota bacterium]
MFLILMFAPRIINAQQYPVLDEYRINPGILAPSFTGISSLFQVYLTQRNEWTGVPGAPVTGAVNIEGTPYQNMGLGANVLLNKAGIVRYFSFNLNYAYHLHLATDHFLHFGISPGLYQNSIDLSNLIIADPNDPMINGSGKTTETYINCGASLMYSFKTLNICVGFPYLFNNKSLYQETQYSNYLTMGTNFQAYLNYLLMFGKDWGMQFDVLYRNMQGTPWIIDAGLMIKYKESFWLGLLYRKGNTIVANAGFSIANSFVLGYNYEFSGSAMMGKSSGTHEITLGYTLQGKKQKKANPLKIKDY